MTLTRSPAPLMEIDFETVSDVATMGPLSMRDFYEIFISLAPLLRHVMSGGAFFSGTLLAGLALVLLLRRKRRCVGVVAVLLVTLGVVLRLASSTPEPAWLTVVWVLTVLSAVVAAYGVRRWGAFRRTVPASAVAFAVSSLASLAIELPWHLTPSPPASLCEKVFVIGDSFSAGIGREKCPWPTLLGEQCGVPVVNLASGGATVASAIRQVEGIAAEAGDGCVVVLEIGGNNMLRRRGAETFEGDLERLILAVKQRAGRIIMLELPLQPLSEPVGRAQRGLACKYGLELIPKRHFAAAVLSVGHTLPDNPHLSDAGHEAMARIVGDYLGGRL